MTSRRRIHNAFLVSEQRSAKVLDIADLRIPVHFCLGHYEAATKEELRDLIADLQHELSRR